MNLKAAIVGVAGEATHSVVVNSVHSRNAKPKRNVKSHCNASIAVALQFFTEISLKGLVAHTGLEPVVSALRGQRVSRLHQCAG